MLVDVGLIFFRIILDSPLPSKKNCLKIYEVGRN